MKTKRLNFNPTNAIFRYLSATILSIGSICSMGNTTSGQSRVLPSRIKGVTLERMQHYSGFNKRQEKAFNTSLSQIHEALMRHRHDLTNWAQWPTTRVVFDLEDDNVINDRQHASNYTNAKNFRPVIDKIWDTTFVMGEILDSAAIKLQARALLILGCRPLTNVDDDD